jgi:hypothetical protein
MYIQGEYVCRFLPAFYPLHIIKKTGPDFGKAAGNGRKFCFGTAGKDCMGYFGKYDGVLRSNGETVMPGINKVLSLFQPPDILPEIYAGSVDILHP